MMNMYIDLYRYCQGYFSGDIYAIRGKLHTAGSAFPARVHRLRAGILDRGGKRSQFTEVAAGGRTGKFRGGPEPSQRLGGEPHPGTFAARRACQ